MPPIMASSSRRCSPGVIGALARSTSSPPSVDSSGASKIFMPACEIEWKAIAGETTSRQVPGREAFSCCGDALNRICDGRCDSRAMSQLVRERDLGRRLVDDGRRRFAVQGPPHRARRVAQLVIRQLRDREREHRHPLAIEPAVERGWRGVEAELPREPFDHDDAGVELAGAGAVAREHLLGEGTERGLRRDGVVDDLAEIRGQLVARTRDDRDLVALIVVRRAEERRERLGIARLGLAVVVEAVLRLVAATAHPRPRTRSSSSSAAVYSRRTAVPIAAASALPSGVTSHASSASGYAASGASAGSSVVATNSSVRSMWSTGSPTFSSCMPSTAYAVCR